MCLCVQVQCVVYPHQLYYVAAVIDLFTTHLWSVTKQTCKNIFMVRRRTILEPVSGSVGWSVCLSQHKFPNKHCVFVRWVTLWVCPPSVKICVSVRWVRLWVLPPLCVSVQLVTLWVRPPLVCVLSLEDNLFGSLHAASPLCGIFFLTN